MSQLNVKESAIKLFGKTIPFKFNHGVSSTNAASDLSVCSSLKPSKRELVEEMQEDDSSHQMTEDLNEPTTSSGNSGNPKTPSVDRETSSMKTSKSEGQSEATKSEENSLKKPDKIVPCPRCNSMDTKFCYFNNYNVNQPRHFCKNCQRYWTAGGTIRNVPVGAGRRKNKNSYSSQYRQLTMSNPLQHAQAGTVLAFGSDSYLCDSITSAQKPEQKSMDRSTGSSITAAQVPCFSGSPWPYPWSVAMPPPAFCPAGYPVAFYPPPAYWGCNVPASWNPNLTTLGKHSRDRTILNQVNADKEDAAKQNKNSEQRVPIPKTLRIDDPAEAAKSSIWTTLGIKLDKKSNSTNGGGLFEAFQPTRDDENHAVETALALQANPAALSRSFNFHEST